MAMTCHDTGPLLSAALDGELSEQEQGELDAHLSTCEACQEKQRALGAVREGFRQAAPKPASPAFTRQLDAAVASAGQRRRWLRRPTTALVSLAVAATLLALLWLRPMADTGDDMAGAECGMEFLAGAQCGRDWSLVPPRQ